MKKISFMVLLNFLMLIILNHIEHNSYSLFEKSNINIPNDVIQQNNFIYGNASMNFPDSFYYLTRKNIKVAILDSGIDEEHPLIKKHFLASFNAIDPTMSTFDHYEHGTHIAGIISSNVPPNIKLISIKVIDDNGFGQVSDLIQGIKIAIDEDVDIINMSLMVKEPNNELERWIKKAHRQGIILVAPTGNNNNNSTIAYPGKYEEVIAVGSYNQHNNLSIFSQHGDGIDFLAPGENILSSVPYNRYKATSGTSQSTAFVTKAIAVCMITNDYKNPDEVINALISSSEDLLLPGHNSKSGHGKINVQNLIPKSFRK